MGQDESKLVKEALLIWQVVSQTAFTLPCRKNDRLFSKLCETTAGETVLVIKQCNWLSLALFWIIFLFFEESDRIQSSLSSTL